MNVLLVDGNALTCRLWWSNPAEVPQRFVNAIARLSLAHEVHVAWDDVGSWRRELLPSYKSNRPPKPEALMVALRECREIRNYTHWWAPGFEADDVIATLCAERADDHVLILSPDKDMAQLVSDRVHLVTFEGATIDAEAVRSKWGVPPERIRHLLSWAGDPSDGLIGVRGIGPKKAVPKALAGLIGDQITYDLVGLAIVPDVMLSRR